MDIFSIADAIILNDYYSFPEVRINENHDSLSDDRNIIMAEHCFEYYINNVSNVLENNLSKKGIERYFEEKLLVLSYWLSGENIAFSPLINLRPSLNLFLQCFADPAYLYMSTDKVRLIRIQYVDKIKKLREKEIDNFERRARKNRKSIRALLDNIYHNRSKVLILRIDLWYEYLGVININQTDKTEFCRDNIECIVKHRDEFIAHLREKFEKDLLGYVWRLEYGLMKGYHLHFLIMLDGQKHCKDVMICNLLGEYWKNEITKKQGGYYNCNANKEKYKTLAIGMTKYMDEEKKMAIDKIVKYFTKFDLLFQVKALNAHRTIGRSGLLKISENKKGRKRSSINFV